MSKPEKLVHPAPYNHRDVMGLLPVSKWTTREETLHLKHNRILQNGFSTRKPQELVDIAKLAGEEWLTDICCPSIRSAIILHLAKELVVNYQIAEDELGKICNDIYAKIIAGDPLILKKLESEVNDRFNKEKASSENIESRARKRLEKNKIVLADLTPEHQKRALAAAIAIENDLIQKGIVHEIIKGFVHQEIAKQAKSLGIAPKPVKVVGENSDFAFLGAAGSGKSTIARQWLDDAQKPQYVILATDNYRAFTIPGSEVSEAEATKDVFTRTQDMAYMVKELVQEELNDQIRAGKRPDVICDCITLEYGMKQLLKQGRITSVVAAYSGDPGYVGIAERADYRARSEAASPADKGRFVNTSALLEGHASASSRLLSSVPEDAITGLYNTNVGVGEKPQLIGQIDSSKKELEIYDLRLVADFMNKRNINAEAENPVGLIYKKDNPLSTLSTHPENQARSLLDLVPQSRFKPAYTIILKDKNGEEYAKLKPNASMEGGVELQVINSEIFAQKATVETIEGSVLRSVTRQIAFGSLEASFNRAFDKGERQAFAEAVSNLRLVVEPAEEITQAALPSKAPPEIDQALKDQAKKLAQEAVEKYKIMQQNKESSVSVAPLKTKDDSRSPTGGNFKR